MTFEKSKRSSYYTGKVFVIWVRISTLTFIQLMHQMLHQHEIFRYARPSDVSNCLLFRLWHEKTDFVEGADQSAYPCSLITTFVIHFLQSMLSELALCIIVRILANVCSWAGWFEPYIVQTPKDRYLAMRPKWISSQFLHYQRQLSFLNMSLLWSSVSVSWWSEWVLQ